MRDFYTHKVSANFSFKELTNTKDHPELLELNREYFLHEPYVSRLTVFAESTLEEIRDAVDAPVIINSCGRCPLLNTAVGGVKTSQHLFSTEYDGAADFYVPGQLVEVVAFKIFNYGVRFYQLRVYTHSNFIHIGNPRIKNNGQIAFPESAIPGWTK